MHKYEGPLFVVGMPRSGTKLLRTILNNHSQIRILSIETEFLPYLVANINSYGDLSQYPTFKQFYKTVQRYTYFRLYRDERGVPISPEAWFESIKQFTPAGIFEALVRIDANAPEGSGLIWGDKSPSYVRSVDLIGKLFPNGRIVHIHRDVRDYCLSLNQAWGKDMLRAAHRWATDVAKARRDGVELKERYIETSYEELIASPADVVEKICKFIDLPFDRAMIELKIPAEKEFEKQGGVGTGQTRIVSGNTGKWANRISANRVKQIEEIACETMRAFGYHVSPVVEQRTISSSSLTFRKFKDGINLILTNRRFKTIEAIRFFFYAYLVASPSLQSRDKK